VQDNCPLATAFKRPRGALLFRRADPLKLVNGHTLAAAKPRFLSRRP
jgi:hypothetical protein